MKRKGEEEGREEGGERGGKKKEEEEDEDEEKETKTLKERYDRRGSSRRVNKKPNPGSGIYPPVPRRNRQTSPLEGYSGFMKSRPDEEPFSAASPLPLPLYLFLSYSLARSLRLSPPTDDITTVDGNCSDKCVLISDIGQTDA